MARWNASKCLGKMEHFKLLRAASIWRMTAIMEIYGYHTSVVRGREILPATRKFQDARLKYSSPRNEVSRIRPFLMLLLSCVYGLNTFGLTALQEYAVSFLAEYVDDAKGLVKG